MQLIDTHVHINFSAFQSDLEAVRRRWQNAGIVRLIHSCVEPSEFHQIEALATQFSEMYFSVGLHPLHANKWIPDFKHDIPRFARSHPKVVAIGETGLDFYKASNLKEQKAVFTAQLHLAKALDLPVIIHCRNAAQPMAELLQDFREKHGTLSGVMHCWGGTPAETQWFLDLGFYISFSGTVTFKNTQNIQSSARMVPHDRILIETDCPFLAPTPKRGKRNEPAYVYHTAQHIAGLRNVNLDDFASQTTQNACQLFRLPFP